MHDVSSRGRVESFVRFLESLRRGARTLLVARAVLLWVAVAIAGLVVGGTLDFILRAPMGGRMIGLIGAVGLGSDFDGVGELPVGLDDVSFLPALRAELERRELPVRPIFGENVLRVLAAQTGE